jgi:hypothetical protein
MPTVRYRGPPMTLANMREKRAHRQYAVSLACYELGTGPSDEPGAFFAGARPNLGNSCAWIACAVFHSAVVAWHVAEVDRVELAGAASAREQHHGNAVGAVADVDWQSRGVRALFSPCRT